MGTGRELSPQMRSAICELRALNYSHSRIHKLHPEIPLGTIKSTLRREATRLDNQSRPRSGGPRKLTETQRDLIYDTVAHTNPSISHKDLLDLVDNAVKVRSLQDLLREFGKRE
jgi:transposase